MEFVHSQTPNRNEQWNCQTCVKYRFNPVVDGNTTENIETCFRPTINRCSVMKTNDPSQATTTDDQTK